MLKDPSTKILAIGIVVVQLLDIIIHAATNQLELIRVASNTVILLWILALPSRMATVVISISLYLLLNIIFLLREGITNNGELRVPLFILILLTTVLSSLLIYKQKNR